MLDINKISHAAVFEESWRKEKLGKISASKFGLLVCEPTSKRGDSDEGYFSAGAITYLEGLAGEIITGKPAQEEFFTNATEHGNAHEAEAVVFAAQKVGLNVLRNSERGGTNRLIIQDEYSGCTPDALLTKYEGNNVFDESGNFLKVSTLEVKCPPTHHRFIKLMKCDTSKSLKDTDKIYYWQVITQMSFCDVLEGYFACYNPDFPIKGKVIKFSKMELREDFKFFSKTLKHAIVELKNIVELLKK